MCTVITMKAFEVKGTFKVGDRTWQKFSLQVASEDAEGAAEKVMTILGSRHRTPRRSINIEAVGEISGKQITDVVVRHQVGAKL